MQELLSNFNALVDSYAEHREYINRAQGQASKFSKAIIEKVVLDHEVKASAVADEVLPVVPDIEAKLDEISAEIAQINGDKGSADETMEELQLRQMIGELTDEEFEAESVDLREKIDGANGRIEALEGDQGALQDALDRWAQLASEAGQDAGIRAGSAKEALADAPVQNETPVVEEDPERGAHSSTEGTQEDVSSVFDEAAGEKGEAIEADQADEEVDFGFDDEEGGSEVELNLVDGGADAGEEGAEEIGIDLGDDGEEEPAEVEAEEEEEEDADDARHALLLYQEGTPDEQIHPFSGEVLTIGRGRDNDIKIQNDSKVSRFHCKLFRRGGNFYIEDNKSSNGTLVNGELITERRLFGGEEVIIGETFFRFRIM